MSVKYKPSLKTLALCLLLVGSLVGGLSSVALAATPEVDCPDGSVQPITSGDTFAQACKGHTKVPKTPVQTTGTGSFVTDNTKAEHQCGSRKGAVATSVNFGCKGESCLPGAVHPDTIYCSGNNSAVLDVTFAIIRFLSYGVGLIVVGSIVVAGLQYTTSQGDPQASAAAQTRIRSTIFALLIYIFSYAILNYVIPKGFLHQ